MQRFFPRRALGALCLLLLTLGLLGRALAEDPANQRQALGDLSSFRAIAADTLAVVNTGNLTRAKARIKDLETNWDQAEATLRPRDPERWRIIDKAIDAVLVQLRADRPQASAAKDALQNLLASFDQPNQSAKVGTWRSRDYRVRQAFGYRHHRRRREIADRRKRARRQF
jgi:hypothetical protein